MHSMGVSECQRASSAPVKTERACHGINGRSILGSSPNFDMKLHPCVQSTSAARSQQKMCHCTHVYLCCWYPPTQLSSRGASFLSGRLHVQIYRADYRLLTRNIFAISYLVVSTNFAFLPINEKRSQKVLYSNVLFHSLFWYSYVTVTANLSVVAYTFTSYGTYAIHNPSSCHWHRSTDKVKLICILLTVIGKTTRCSSGPRRPYKHVYCPAYVSWW